MKMMNRLLLVLAALTLVIALGSCEVLEDVSAEDRMDDFIADVNGGDFDLKEHTSPLASYYDTADVLFWQGGFSAYVPLSGPSEVYENDDAAAYTAVGTGPITFTFVLVKAGKSFLIQRITRGSDVIFQ